VGELQTSARSVPGPVRGPALERQRSPFDQIFDGFGMVVVVVLEVVVDVDVEDLGLVVDVAEETLGLVVDVAEETLGLVVDVAEETFAVVFVVVAVGDVVVVAFGSVVVVVAVVADLLGIPMPVSVRTRPG
jgi:hypothetical protein